MPVHLIISNTIRYNFVEQLAISLNVIHYYINEEIYVKKQLTDGIGALKHICMDSNAYEENCKNITQELGSMGDIKSHTCHLVISAEDISSVPAFVMEKIDHVYIFQQKTARSIATIHDNFLHHVFSNIENTKKYMFKVLSTTNHYIHASGYPYQLKLVEFDEKQP